MVARVNKPTCSKNNQLSLIIQFCSLKTTPFYNSSNIHLLRQSFVYRRVLGALRLFPKCKRTRLSETKRDQVQGLLTEKTPKTRLPFDLVLLGGYSPFAVFFIEISTCSHFLLVARVIFTFCR